MPILISNKQFVDISANITNYYISDAGDQTIVGFNLRSAVRMSSIGNPLILDPSLNTIQSTAVSWVQEGFRVGDWVRVIIHNSGGSPIPGPNGTFWSLVNYVDDITIDLNGVPVWYNLANGQFATMYVVTGNGSNNFVTRDDLDTLFNHVKNSSPGSEFSLIDGEVTRAQFTGVSSMIVGQILPAVLVGNQSGSFLISAEIERFPNEVDGWTNHKVTFVFSNPGIYDNGTWFFSSECLKLFVKFAWARLAGEPFAKTEAIFNEDGNTGQYNEPFNSGINDAVLVSGPSEIDYTLPTTFDLIGDGPLGGIGLGAMYKSIDTNYYKNRVYSQQVLTMAVTTDIINNFFGAGKDSFLNEFGAGYNLTLDNLVQLGTITTATITITPNAAFSTFMDAREDDRLFYLWLRCGNLNLLGFADQLTTSPPVGGPLIMVDDIGFLDHSQNVETGTGILTGFIADTEDDLAYLGTFLLDKNQVYESFSAKIEAFNTVTEDDFTLQIVNFSFAGVQISGAGVYLLNETQNVINTLPTTSVKLNARLILDPTLDTPTQYGVKIYYPILLDWRYWLSQNGVNVDFYPTQNKNWEQYDDPANWVLRTELQLIKDGLAFVHSNVIEDAPYNNEADINSEIELLLEPTLQVVTVVPNSSLMRIKSTHENLLGAWGPNTWGMLTIEPYEGGPRWICSTVVPFDSNTANPLTPLNGLLINIDYPAPNIAVFNCNFDTNLIDLSNGVKITAKIKDPDTPPVPYEFPIPFGDQARLAYSTAFKLSPNNVYNGPIMKVRRSIDDATQDIPFNNTQIDNAELLNFVGNGVDDNGYIVTLYDQSGDNNHAITNIFADQPQIVKNGIILTSVNGLTAGLSDGVFNNFNISTPVPNLQNFYAFQVFDRIAGGKTSLGIATSGPSGPIPFGWTAIDRVIDIMGAVANNWTNPGVDTSTGNFLFTSFRDGANNMTMQKDGVPYPTSPIVTPLVAGFMDKLLQRPAPIITHNGYFQEIILFMNDQSANLATLNANIKTRYNIP